MSLTILTHLAGREFETPVIETTCLNFNQPLALIPALFHILFVIVSRIIFYRAAIIWCKIFGRLTFKIRDPIQ